jgi:GTP pyrophosphokinase
MRKPVKDEEKDDTILDKIIHRVRKKKTKTGVTVKGIDDVLVRFAKCCQPVPGDPVIGYITQGRGVTVHRVNCVNALKVNPDRQIEVEWNDTSTEETYPVKIHIHSFDRVGLLADLAANISKNGANILNVHSDIRENSTVDTIFTLAIKNTNHLNRVLAAIKKVKQITKVERIEG